MKRMNRNIGQHSPLPSPLSPPICRKVTDPHTKPEQEAKDQENKKGEA
jgi:hypothetical protein